MSESMSKHLPIYLVSRAPGDGSFQHDLPLGALYVSSALKRAGYPSRVIRLQGSDDRELLEAVDHERPLFVGFSNFVSPLLRYDYEASRRLSAQGMTVVWGGLFSTSLPRTALESGVVDYVVAGEGEVSGVALAEAIRWGEEPKGIAGVGYRRGEEFVLNPPDPPCSDLDTFGLDLDGLDPEDFIITLADGRTRVASIPFSRGCPFSCTFCYNSMSPHRQRWTAHSAEYLSEIIGFFKPSKADCYVFRCDNPFGKPKKARAIIEKLGVKWRAHIHLTMVDPDILDWALDNGCERLDFGVESGSDRTLARLNKRITRETIVEKVRLCASKGVSTSSSWMGMLPGESREELRQTFTLMEEVRRIDPVHRIKFGVFRLYPHTLIWQEAIEHGFDPPQSLDDWCDFKRLSFYPVLGYSDREAYWMFFLANKIYSPEFSPPGLRARTAKAFLRGMLQRTPPSTMQIALLEAAQRLRSKQRGL